MHPDFTSEISTENLLHYLRCLEADPIENHLDYSDFEKRIQIVTSKVGAKYKFLTNAGKGLKDCLYQLFSKVWDTE